MYECDICKSRISLKKDLKSHMKNVHDIIYKVNVEHTYSINENTKHKCPVCSLVFVERSSLRRHEKLKHNIIFTQTLRSKKLTKCVTFEPINLEDYPLLKNLLPDDYVYKVNNIENLENNQFRAKFEIADCLGNTFMDWLSELQKKSKVIYRVKSFTKSSNPKVIFNKVYRCVHNTFPSKYSTNPHPKHTGCPATLTVRILKCSEALSVKNTMADNVIIIPHKAILTLYHCHNHVLYDVLDVCATKKKKQRKNNEIQLYKRLNHHKINKKLYNFNPNTSSSCQVSIENNKTEMSEEMIIPYEPENSTFVMNDNIQNSSTKNDIELSKEFDNYILVGYENTKNMLHNNDNENELQQLLSDYDTVNERMLLQFQSNPKYFKSAIKTYTLAMKNSLTSKESLLSALKSFSNLQEQI